MIDLSALAEPTGGDKPKMRESTLWLLMFARQGMEDIEAVLRRKHAVFVQYGHGAAGVAADWGFDQCKAAPVVA